MIGLMNIPEEKATEFYTACPRLQCSIEDPAEILVEPKMKTLSRPQRLISIFGRKKNSDLRVRYLPDGRKIVAGMETEKASAPKLWEQLIIRSFLHKLQDEITCPVTRMNVAEKHLPPLSPTGRSNSTFSLVSENRIVSGCNKCNEKSAENTPTENVQSEQPSKISFETFK